MKPLISAFCAHAPFGRDGDAAALERALQAMVAAGTAAWPSIPLDPEELAARAARAIGAVSQDALVSAVSALSAADLHLATACALGLPGAAEALDRGPLAADRLRPVLGRIDPSPEFVDDVRAVVREKLLVGGPGAPPRIADYTGQGSLAGWVRAVALRAAIDLTRGAKTRKDAGGELPEPLAELPCESPELRYAKQLDARAFREALEASISALDDEQANLLALAHVDGLRSSQIAAVLQVDRSTVKRRLAACRQLLEAETRRRLCERLRLSERELQSLADLVQSQLNLSLERILRKDGPR